MKFTTAWSETAAQNQFLKILVLLMTMISCVLGVLSARLALQEPLIIQSSPKTSVLALAENEHSVDEIEAFLGEVMPQRFDSDGAIDRNFFSSKELLNHSKEVQELKKQKVRQRFLMGPVVIDGDRVEIGSDRVLALAGTKSLFSFPVEVKVQKTKRSLNNPYGLVVSEVKQIKPKISKGSVHEK